METDHYYFSNIDTEFKAYILGLVYSDGCLIKPSNYGGKERAARLSLSVQIRDENVIDAFGMAIKGKPGIIKHSPAQIKHGHQPQKILNVSSNRLYKDLVNMGCYPNKTVIGIKFPELKQELIPHFIRGFFDGDGCITVDFPKSNYVSKITGKVLTERKPIRGRITFTNTDKVFLEKLASFLPISTYYLESKTKNIITYMLKIERQADVLNTLNFIYKDHTICFSRKIEKMNMLISSQAKATALEGSETT